MKRKRMLSALLVVAMAGLSPGSYVSVSASGCIRNWRKKKETN